MRAAPAADASSASPLHRRLDSIASRPVVQVGPGASLREVARLMATQRIACVPVTDADGRVLGMVTERRLLAVLRGQFADDSPAQAAVEPLPSADGGLRCDAAWQLCLDRGSSHLAVVDAAQRLVGLVSETDFRQLMQLGVLAGRQQVREVMRSAARLVRPGQTLREAAALMDQGDDAAVVVVDAAGTPLGVLTARDSARCLASRPDATDADVATLMGTPVLDIPAGATLNEAAERMLQHRVRHLVVLDDAQRMVGLLGSRDLTRAMAAGLMDDAARQDRARHRAILDALPDLVWLKDPDGVFLACNPRVEQLLGVPQARILGRTDLDFVPPEQAASFRANDRAAVAAGAPVVNEELLRFASDGHSELTQTIKTPVHDTDGRLLGVLGIGRDITALRRAEDEYRLLFERNPAPMLICNRADQRLHAVNDAFCALYGWNRSEALQLQVSDLMHPTQRDEARARLAQAQGLVTREWRHQRHDGSPMQVLVQSHDILRDGMHCRLVVITDITRWHRNQQREQSRLRLLDSLIRGDPLAQQLEQLVLDHEAAFPGSLGSVLLLDAAGQQLLHGAAPSLPAFFNDAIHGLAIGPQVGACGSAAHAGQRVVCEDLATDPRWQTHAEVVQRAGLGACWSTPIMGAGGQVLGTFAAYRRGPAHPSDEELEHAHFAAGLAALAITQQRSAQRLRDSERRLADTLQALPDPIWLTDVSGGLALANAAYRRLVEPPPDAGDDARAAAQHNRETLARNDSAVAHGGQPGTAEQRLLLPPDGRPALFEVVATPMRDGAGQHTGVLGAARDITLLRQGAQAVADQLRLVDTMLSQTSDAIVLFDPQTLRAVHFNDVACEGLGYSRQAFTRLHLADMQAGLGAVQVEANTRRVMAGETLRMDNMHRHRDGRLLQVELTLRRLDYGGRPLLSAVWQDVTERRRRADSVRRLNQAYAVLSGANEAIVRLQDGPALLAEVCRISVQVGGFHQAWIGWREGGGGGGGGGDGDGQDEREGAWRTAAGSGGTPDVAPPWVEAAGRALGTDAPLVLDLPGEAGISVAAFPITLAGSTASGGSDGQVGAAGTTPSPRGLLLLQADGAGHFQDDQLALYGRLVRDVGHAIESIAAEAARRREQRLREQLMESVAGLFFVLAPDGRVLLWNRRFETLTGYSGDEVRTSRAADYFAPDRRPALTRQLARVLAGHELQTEVLLMLRDGRRVPFLLVARRVDLETGPVVAGTGIDIADRVAAEHELTLHRRHLEDLVAQRTQELERANRRLNLEDLRLRAMLTLSQRAAGLDEPALWRAGIDTLVGLCGGMCGSLQPVDTANGQPGAPVWSAGTPAALHTQAAGGPTAQLLASLRSSALHSGGAAQALLELDGQPHRLLVLPVQDQGHHVLLVCVLHAGTAAAGTPPAPELPASAAHDLALAGADLWDIVQRRRTEIALAQAKATADAASQAKSAFLANMSHEIRTPLNAVLGFAHLLQREPLSPRQLEHLGKIADASQHLLQVINDILDFSKIEASKVQLDPTDFALQPCLQRMLAMVADRARGSQVLLRLDLDPASPAMVLADRLRLEQILLNLLSNAVKFSPGGRVTLEVGPTSPGWLRFDVVDTGIGIGADQLPLLFKPFQQADASTTRRFGGTGLGLAICHRLALLMGGHIGVTSRPGAGSRFRLELPVPRSTAPLPGAAPLPLPVAVPTAPPLAADGAALHGLHVLLAEDNLINQEVAIALLQAQGARVDVADDGEVALQRARARLYDLVLMDVQMPRLDGLRAAEAIRALPGWAKVPIVAMTASAFPEDRADCLRAGMNDVLVKPVRPDALTRCLLQWCEPPDAAQVPQAMPAVAPSTEPATGQRAPAPEAVRQSLLVLRRLLQSHDTEAADHLLRDAGLLRAALGAAYAELDADIQSYAFASALARVDALLAAGAR